MMDPITKSPAELAESITQAALALGFSRVGFAGVEPFVRGAQALDDWLAQDLHGELAYMSKYPGRSDPRSLLQEAKTLIVVALAYPAQPEGIVARYARGEDYHFVLKSKLYALADACTRIAGRPVLARPCVDTAPILEREAAARAGVGFIAKSTLAIVPGVGSYVLLGELLVDLDIAPSTPQKPRCGSCTMCLQACPTQAFVGPYVLDARRCVSYLTIELQGPIPHELRPLMGSMVFGCDICQQVCPFNASPKVRPSAPEFAAKEHLSAPDIVHLLTLTSGDYKRFVRGTALRRVRREQLQRNAAVALGNVGTSEHVPILQAALKSSPLVQGHVLWALGQIAERSDHDVQNIVRAVVEMYYDAADAFVREEARAIGNPTHVRPAASGPPTISPGPTRSG